MHSNKLDTKSIVKTCTALIMFLLMEIMLNK